MLYNQVLASAPHALAAAVMARNTAGVDAESEVEFRAWARVRGCAGTVVEVIAEWRTGLRLGLGLGLGLGPWLRLALRLGLGWRLRRG